MPARKPLGANFYPEDMTREEFEAWVKTLSDGRTRSRPKASSPSSAAMPSRQAHRRPLQPGVRRRSEEGARRLLREAAALTDNASLKKFLTLRADAFLSNDYYASDVAWMDLDAPLDITIGPYETYNDELFGYKAGFEAYITSATKGDRPAEDLRRSPAGGGEQPADRPASTATRSSARSAPIRVVNEVYAPAMARTASAPPPSICPTTSAWSTRRAASASC